MSIKKISKNQPEKFEFSQNNLNIVNKIIKNYPTRKTTKHCHGPVILGTKSK